MKSEATFGEISQLIYKHLEERDWHNNPPRGLAISIALEANELLEHYQWHDEPVGSKQDLAEELADIFIYAFEFAMSQDIDIAESIRLKLAKAAKKYPAGDFKNVPAAESKKNWLNAKLNHKKTGL